MSNHIEHLERRSVKSATLDGSSLVITGTAGNDAIVVSVDDGNPSELNVSINGTVTQFDLAQVAKMRITADAGDDTIHVDDNGSAIAKSIRIYGEAGDDSI